MFNIFKIGFIIYLCQCFIDKTINKETFIGIIILCLISCVSLWCKKYLKFLPTFAIGSILGFILTLPNIQTNIIIPYMDKIQVNVLVIPIVCIISLSSGNMIDKLKNISWKICIMAIVIYTINYFGSAIVADLVLRLRG